LTGGILQAIDQGCFVVVSSQCAFGQADLSIYEVGRAAMDVGAMSAYDMTSEATLVKLAWVLGHTKDPGRVQEMMRISYVGEMSYIELE
jgi:L-asparaginase